MRGVGVLISLVAAGCNGPLSQPMVTRLDEAAQARVDDVWADMLITPNELDCTLLLDVILAGKLHQYGVDYLRMISEKQVGEGRVIMDVRFDRESPDDDVFIVTYVDREGYLIREERYSREDVQERQAFLLTPVTTCEEMGPEADDLAPHECEALARRAEERAARMEEICAFLAPLKREDAAVGADPPDEE